jgi:cell wall-associated NlpC family hydrolase
MRYPAPSGLIFLRICLLGCLVALPAAGQEERAASNVSTSAMRGGAYVQRSNVRLVSRVQGLTIARVAMNSRHPLSSRYDCSHFVHGLYQRAGFPYEYAPSSQLYAGVPEFRRVASPQPGDLAVWLGHAGVVINPAQHSFLSVLRAGPGVDRYDSHYWQRRGRPRFLRYVRRNSADTPRNTVMLSRAPLR